MRMHFEFLYFIILYLHTLFIFWTNYIIYVYFLNIIFVKKIICLKKFEKMRKWICKQNHARMITSKNMQNFKKIWKNSKKNYIKKY